MTVEVRNQLLKYVPAVELEQVVSAGEFVHIDPRDTAYEPNQPIRFVDFVETGLHSLLGVVDGVEIEIATVGHEGMIGVPLLHGSDLTISKCFCQVPGSSWRIEASPFKELLTSCPTLYRLCLRYSFSVYEQTAQNSVCNRVHSIEERCAKWLLLTQDRVGSSEFELTQEFLAQMLGVRRNSVNLAAGILQNAGFIRYTRGKIAVLDRNGLEDVTCDCYKVIRNSMDHLSGPLS